MEVGCSLGGNATSYEDFADAIAIHVAWSDDGSNILKVWKEICFREPSIAIVVGISSSSIVRIDTFVVIGVEFEGDFPGIIKSVAIGISD